MHFGGVEVCKKKLLRLQIFLEKKLQSKATSVGFVPPCANHQ